MPETLPDYKLLFQTAPLLILVLSPELIIMDATEMYLSATLRKREELVGLLVYDAFPDNPGDPNPQGVANLKATFNRVLANKVPDAMGELKYDIPREDGSFESRYWTTMNTPVLDKDGNILHIINHVMDITDYVVLREKGKEHEQLTHELRQKAENMEGEIYLRVKQLQTANEKMSQANEELRIIKEELQATNEALHTQQEELQAAHEELSAQQEELIEMNSELTQKNESLEKASLALLLKAEELERSGSFKTDFLSNMSHELRTPLNSMLILSKLLANNTGKNLTDKQVEQANIIHKAGNDLLKLINDILDLSKIEAGKIEMIMEQTAVKDIVTGISDIFTSIAEQKGIRFNITVTDDVPEQLNTDRFRLEQILKNLLSNAFKFTEKDGSVTFNVSMTDYTSKYAYNSILRNGTRTVCFSVSDTGIGIPEHKQSDIFEAFRQADGGTSRKYGGTGLGLSISRQLAGLLGGDIQLESEENKGSTFYIYLPVEYQPVPTNSLAENTDGHQSDHKYVSLQYNTIPVTPSAHMKEVLKGKTILITDDDDRNITALKMVLDGYGPILLTAGNGKEALKILDEQEHVDMVLMDVMMPEMDGYEAIKKIRRQSRLKKLPIIVLTAKVMKSDQENCISAGASDYLPKPIDVPHLLAVMELWLNGKQPRKINTTNK